MTLKKFRIIAAVCALAMIAAGCGEIDESTAAAPESKTESITDSTAESIAENDESETFSQAEQTESAPENTKEPLSSSSEQTEGETDVDKGFIDGTADFSAELFRKTAAEDISNGKNAFMSPESVLFAIGMTANGAQGDTLTEMQSVMGTQDIESLNKNLSALKRRSDKSEFIDFSIANSLWVKDNKTITLNESFADTVKESFGAEVFYEPFDNATKDSINGWVNENTNEMIPSILDEISKDEVAYLINAIAFEAQWAEQYDDSQTEEETFTSADGEKQTCTMLSGMESQYLHDDKAEGFLKYYEGYDYAFMAMLPNEGVSLSDYLDTMTGETLNAFYNSKEDGDVYTKTPEFSYDYDAELSESLKKMGMPLAFTPAADFSAMAETDTDVLYISRVLHKAHIELDRNGTKAAAATLVAMNKASAMAPVEKKEYYVYLDRPFLFAIVDCENGLPVFMGAVNTLE